MKEMNFLEWRRRILARDPVCRICNKRYSQTGHHIINKGAGGKNELENGLGICAPCHTEIHSTGKKIKESQLTPDQIAYIEKHRWPGWKKIDWGE